MSEVKLRTTPAFVTGSRAYGEPREDSDVDLVVLMDSEGMRLLASLVQDDDRKDYPEATSVSLRFGELNLIVCTSQEDYDDWVTGTAELKAKSPVGREEAVATFKRLFSAPSVPGLSLLPAVRP